MLQNLLSINVWSPNIRADAKLFVFELNRQIFFVSFHVFLCLVVAIKQQIEAECDYSFISISY